MKTVYQLETVRGNARQIFGLRSARSKALLLSFLLPALSSTATPPIIFPGTATSAYIGDTITISGANFAPTPTDNIVHFGAVTGLVTSASSTSLGVVVPPGATYAPITVTVGSLTAYSPLPFGVKFNSVGSVGFDFLDFPPPFSSETDLPADAGEIAAVAIADIDGDGKPDIIVANRASQSISVFQNLSKLWPRLPPGSITAASFGTKVDFPTGAAADGPITIAVADLDGDGKLDVVVGEPTGGTISVFRNTSTPGSISASSLAPAVAFAGGAGVTSLAIADLDGDGKPEIVCGTLTSVNVLRNTSSPGSLDVNSFAPVAALFGSGGISGVAIADLDGDGKPDLVVSVGDGGGSGSDLLALVRNSSVVGSIAFENALELQLSDLFPNLFVQGTVFWTGVTIGDLNGDGKPDIGVAFGLLGLVLNNSAPGSFSRSAFKPIEWEGGDGLYTAAMADLQGDGYPDIVGAGAPWPYVGNLDFLPVIGPQSGVDIDFPFGSECIALGDLDGDGKPDVVEGYKGGGKISILRNTIAACTPPMLTALSITEGQTINLGFDQPVTPDSAQNIANYTINQPGVTVISASLPGGGPQAGVTLTISATLGAPGTAFSVTASGILPFFCNEPAPFPGGGRISSVVPSGGGGAQSLVIDPNQSSTVATPNLSTSLAAGQAAVSATINNVSGSASVNATTATYNGNPTGSSIIDVGGGYVDLQISGATAGDSVVGNFYYPSSITGTTESSLALQYFNGAAWAPVLSSGGITPLKNTTDNLDGTTSGGRFTVTFDSSSTPPITGLGGTVFAVAPPDTTPPVLGACPTGGPYLLNSGVQTTPPITATDNCALNLGLSTLTCAIDTSSVGSKPVTFKAVDTSGNTSVQNCSYLVTYQPAGVSCSINGSQVPGHQILPPVNASAPYSVFKQGSVVPLKFAVFDANCKSVGTPGVVTGMTLEAALNGTTSDINETIVSATPDSAFRWDSANQQWVFNLSTKNLPKNATFYYTVTLNDGTTINFQFGLK